MLIRSLIARLFGPRAPETRPTLVLYTRADCPLCDEMKAVLAGARVRPAFRLEEVDVERDPELLARFGRSVPVLALAGRVAFKGRMTLPEFERKYARLVAEVDGETSRAGPGGGQSAHG